jgi:hypothetical protein
VPSRDAVSSPRAWEGSLPTRAVGGLCGDHPSSPDRWGDGPRCRPLLGIWSAKRHERMATFKDDRLDNPFALSSAERVSDSGDMRQVVNLESLPRKGEGDPMLLHQLSARSCVGVGWRMTAISPCGDDDPRTVTVPQKVATFGNLLVIRSGFRLRTLKATASEDISVSLSARPGAMDWLQERHSER